jgi:pimeloyl-ACP methyl ester carboxylesterase
MPNVFDHAARLAMRVRGYEPTSVATPAGALSALVWRGKAPAPPLCIVHGWASAGVHYVLSARRLRHHTSRLVLPDLPGHGWSEEPPALDPLQVEAGLTAALDALFDQSFVLVGSSLGGLAAARYALQRPERVARLVLSSPFGAPLLEHDKARLRGLLRARSIRDTKRFLDCLAVRSQRRNWLFAPEMQRILRRPVLQGLLDTLDATPLLDRAALDALSVPTTVLWGRHEGLLPRRHMDFWAQGPTVQVVEAPHSGHSPAIDEPALFEKVVRDALQGAANCRNRDEDLDMARVSA